jgi:hypothetical protein
VPSWLFFVLPLHLFVRPHSLFWHPVIIAIVGFVSGCAAAVLPLVVMLHSPGSHLEGFEGMMLLGGLFGFVIGLASSFFMWRFRRSRKAGAS